jgi:hypothetical protein
MEKGDCEQPYWNFTTLFKGDRGCAIECVRSAKPLRFKHWSLRFEFGIMEPLLTQQVVFWDTFQYRRTAGGCNRTSACVFLSSFSWKFSEQRSSKLYMLWRQNLEISSRRIERHGIVQAKFKLKLNGQNILEVEGQILEFTVKICWYKLWTQLPYHGPMHWSLNPKYLTVCGSEIRPG